MGVQMALKGQLRSWKIQDAEEEGRIDATQEEVNLSEAVKERVDNK